MQCKFLCFCLSFRYKPLLLSRLTKRVERMEGVIGNIVSKIDKVLIKLESMEKSKSKKKQNLGKLFDGLTNDDAGKISCKLCNKQSWKVYKMFVIFLED